MVKSYYCNKCKHRHMSGSDIHKRHKRFANTGRPKGSKNLNNIFQDLDFYKFENSRVIPDLSFDDYSNETVGEIISIVGRWVGDKKVAMVWEQEDEYKIIKPNYKYREEKHYANVNVYLTDDEYEDSIGSIYFSTYKNMMRMEFDDGSYSDDVYFVKI